MFGLLFLVVIVTAIVEMFLSGLWVPAYFRMGVPLFVRSFRFSVDSLKGNIASLPRRFDGRFWPPIVFQSLSSNEVAFRERFFSFSWFSYTPIMHGLIRADHDAHEASVTGYANWFPIPFIALFVSLGLSMAHDLMLDLVLFTLFPFLLLVALYAIQYYRFSQVHEHLERGTLGPPSGRDETEAVD